MYTDSVAGEWEIPGDNSAGGLPGGRGGSRAALWRRAHPALLCTGFSGCLLGAGDKMAQKTSRFPVLPEDRWVEACVHSGVWTQACVHVGCVCLCMCRLVPFPEYPLSA